MNLEKMKINGTYIITPIVYEDNRGNFYESYNKEQLATLGLNFDFVQDNESYNKKQGTVRGLHFQVKDFSQSKLIRVSKGSIYGVCVDLRKESPTYKKHISTKLSSQNHKQLLVPKGCAWGFQTLSDDTTVCYKLDNFFNNNYEYGVNYEDPELKINWPIRNEITISDKDKNQPLLENLSIDILMTGGGGVF